MRIRVLLRKLHRDVGYLAVGLTIIFSISGIAVNHIHQWNPNYSIEIIEKVIQIDSTHNTEKIIEIVLNNLFVEKYDSYLKSGDELHIFSGQDKVKVNIESGQIVFEKIADRPFLREFNFLHLNESKKIWTYVSDIFAVALIFLATSGMFLLKGKQGITKRGAWLVSIGLIIPLIFLIIYKI